MRERYYWGRAARPFRFLAVRPIDFNPNNTGALPFIPDGAFL